MKTNGYYIIYGMEIGYKSFRIFMGKYTGERPGGSPENPNDDDDGAYKETSSEQKINIWRGRTVEVISRACVSEVVRMKPPQAYLCVVYSTGAAHMQRDSFHAKLCRSIKKRRRSINDSLFFCVFINKDNVSAVFLILRPADGDRQSAGEKTRQWIRRNEEKCCV